MDENELYGACREYIRVLNKNLYGQIFKNIDILKLAFVLEVVKWWSGTVSFKICTF